MPPTELGVKSTSKIERSRFPKKLWPIADLMVIAVLVAGCGQAASPQITPKGVWHDFYTKKPPVLYFDASNITNYAVFLGDTEVAKGKSLIGKPADRFTVPAKQEGRYDGYVKFQNCPPLKECTYQTQSFSVIFDRTPPTSLGIGSYDAEEQTLMVTVADNLSTEIILQQDGQVINTKTNISVPINGVAPNRVGVNTEEVKACDLAGNCTDLKLKYIFDLSDQLNQGVNINLDPKEKTVVVKGALPNQFESETLKINIKLPEVGDIVLPWQQADCAINREDYTYEASCPLLNIQQTGDQLYADVNVEIKAVHKKTGFTFSKILPLRVMLPSSTDEEATRKFLNADYSKTEFNRYFYPVIAAIISVIAVTMGSITGVKVYEKRRFRRERSINQLTTAIRNQDLDSLTQLLKDKNIALKTKLFAAVQAEEPSIAETILQSAREDYLRGPSKKRLSQLMAAQKIIMAKKHLAEGNISQAFSSLQSISNTKKLPPIFQQEIAKLSQEIESDL